VIEELGIMNKELRIKTNHPWQGISQFKARFGGRVILYPPEQTIVLRPVMKTMLGLKRKVLG
jgi:lipid II:glycine glycyltransferase (peptidoglycan interpeptide bridge formation enzyme)